MIKKHFYTHIIDTSILSLELGEMNITQKERIHLKSLIDINIHHEVLDLILSELNHDDKKIFLAHVASEDHNKIWQFLKEKIEDVENKIKRTAEDIKKELHEDIAKAKAS